MWIKLKWESNESFWIAFILYPLDSFYPYPTTLILFALIVCVRLVAPSFSYDNICRFMPFGVSTDKTIWISVKWSHTRSAIAVWNGYVNRFCCRLFAAYFLQMVYHFLLYLASLSFGFSFFSKCELTIPASVFNQLNRFLCCLRKNTVVTVCMFGSKLKCNDIYCTFLEHGVRNAIAYANIISR